MASSYSADDPTTRANVELANLALSLDALQHAITQPESTQGKNKTKKISREEAEKRVDASLNRIVYSQMNQISSSGNPGWSFGARAALDRVLESLLKLQAGKGGPDDDCGLEENMKAFVQEADPNHPFVNQEVADAIAERDSRRHARIAAAGVLDRSLELERLFDEHFGTDIAEEYPDETEDGDGADASGAVDTQMGGV